MDKKTQQLNEKLIADLRKMAGLPVMEKHGHYAPVEGEEIPKNDTTGDHHKPKKGAELPPKSTGDTPHTDDESRASLPGGGKGGDHAPKGGEGGEEPAYSEVVTAMAAKIEGKTGDELIDLISKLYDAGVKDGIAQAKADEEGGEPKKEKKDKDDEPKDEKKDKEEKEPKGDDELPPEDDLPPEEDEEKLKEDAQLRRLRMLINY